MANLAPLPPSEQRNATAETVPSRPRATVGDLLRRTRLEQNGDLDAIGAVLRVRAAYLGAIESGRYDRLPGAVYAQGFVRAYANHLGLDGEEAVRRFKLESSGLETKRDLSIPMPLTQRSIPGGRVVVSAVVLAVCAYGVWHYLSTEDRARPERVAAVPQDLLPAPATPPQAQVAVPPPATPAQPSAAAPGAPPPATTPAAPAATAAASPPPSAALPANPPGSPGQQVLQQVTPAPPPVPVTASPLPPPGATAAPTVVASAVPPAQPPTSPTAPPAVAPAVAAATPAPVLAQPPAPSTVVDQVNAVTPPPAAAQGAHVYGAVDGPSRITLHADKDCWIQVRDSSDTSGAVIAQRTLRAGDSYRVPQHDGLVLRTGNATGLSITVDDKPIKALGGTVRTVALDPDKLVAGTAIAN